MNRTASFLLLCLSAVACSKQDEMLPLRDASVPIRINEVFAAGGHKRAADERVSSDWLELFNAGTAVPLDEGDWFLTDDRRDLMKFELPAIILGEQQHLRIWCDASDGEGIHTSFKLSSKGEWIALVHLKNGRPAIVDSVSFPAQTRRRMSTSRYPDGAENWVKASMATPGAANASSAIQNEVAGE